MEIVVLLSCMYSEGSYYWGLVWVELAIDLIFEGMVMEVVDFDVVGSDDVVEDFVENFVEDFEDKNVGMVDTDSMESIFHRDFVFLSRILFTHRESSSELSFSCMITKGFLFSSILPNLS